MTPPTHSESSLQGTLIGVVACLIWSTTIFVMNRLAIAFHPLRAAGYELIMAGAFLLMVAWLRGEIKRIAVHPTACYLVCGAFWIVNLALSWLALGLVRNGGELVVAGLINYLWPSCTLLLAVPILHKRATWWVVPGMAAVIGGIVLAKLSTSNGITARDLTSSLNIPAYLCAFFGAVTWGFYSNYSRKLSNPAGASIVPAYMLVASALMFGASAVFEPTATPSLEHWALMVVWALLSAVAYLSWDVGMRRGNVVAISTTSMLIPLASTVITALLSGVGLTVAMLIASLLVVGGSVLCRRGVV